MLQTLQRSHAIETAPGAVGPVLAGIVRAKQRAAEVLDARLINEHAAAVAPVVARGGRRRLFAASPAGFVFVGTLLARDPEFELYREGCACDVVLIDVAVAGRTGLEMAAARLLATGATHVDILVVDEVSVLLEPRAVAA